MKNQPVPSSPFPVPRSLFPVPSSPFPLPFHKGFTLVELLVVIGIICVLAGVMLATFGSSTESAQAAQCFNNLRSLAVAANTQALKTGTYPSAGSVELVGLSTDDSKTYYASHPGWISWLSKDKYVDAKGRARASGHQNNANLPYYGNGNDEDSTYALTNGAVWKASSKNRALYVCPVHQKQCGHGTVYWSYVMNARFGWDYSEGAKAIGTSESGFGVDYGSLARPDKTLMFAELPTIDPSSGQNISPDGNGLTTDCVLQYEDVQSTGEKRSKGPYSSSGGKAESIGFCHKAGKRIRCAHVAFADGHTERLVWKDGGIDTKKLTAYLCRGWDVSFDAKGGWKLAENADQSE